MRLQIVLSTTNLSYSFVCQYVTFEARWQLKLMLGQTSNYYSCCYWNVKIVLAHNIISLLAAYNTLQRADIISVSEKYLDFTTDDKGIIICTFLITFSGLFRKSMSNIFFDIFKIAVSKLKKLHQKLKWWKKTRNPKMKNLHPLK